MKWHNYVVPGIKSMMTDNHIPAEELEAQIQTRPPVEGYHGVFDLEPRDTFKDYSGLMKPALGLVFFDFDNKESWKDAHADAKNFVLWLGVKDVHISFSGNRGFHVGVPQEYLGITGPSADLANRLKNLAERLQEKFTSLDTSLYQAAHKIRVPGSLHPKSKLFKMYLPYEELFSLTLDEIKFKAGKERGELKLNGSGPNPERKPIQALVDMLSQIKEKKKTEYKEETTEFDNYKTYDEKVCISKLLTKAPGSNSRHEIANVIMSDLFYTGHHREDAEKIILDWANKNGLAQEGRESELLRYLDNLYSGQSRYSFGCNNPIKRKWCSAKCAIWGKLNRETRPQPMDAPFEKYERAEKQEEQTETQEGKFDDQLHVYSAEERRGKVNLDPDWIVDQMFARDGSSLLSADPKAGKSTLTRFLAVSLADGKEFLGFKCKPSKVLMIAVEENERYMHNSFIKQGLKNWQNIFYHVASTPTDALNKAEDEIIKVKPDFVILDTLFKILETQDENAYSETAKQIARVQNLVHWHKVHILCVHHNNKGGSKGFNKILGSTAIRGAFSYNMVIDCDPKELEKDTATATRFVMSEGREGNFLKKTAMEFDPVRMSFKLGKSYDEFMASKEEKALMDKLAKIKDPQTKTKWKGMLIGDQADRQIKLESLIKLGHIVEVEVNGKKLWKWDSGIVEPGAQF